MKNVIGWFDVPTKDFDRAVKFYSDILGKSIKVDTFMNQKLGFFPMDGRDGVGGDIIPPSKDHKPSSDGTRVYLTCEDKLDKVISRVEKAGGKVLKPKFSIGDMGMIAIIQDSEGNHIGLHGIK